MGNLELLRKHLSGNARAQRLIEGAIQGAERGASLTQRMLAFAGCVRGRCRGSSAG
jgi:hypothetical protein